MKSQNTLEEWRPIDGYENLYAVSDRGRVMNLKSGKILKPVVNKYGYEYANLYKNGKVKKFKIHRLVANAFIPNINNFPQVNHRDECKTNNNVYNLEWVTASQNIRHSIHKQSVKINQLSLNGDFIKCWNSSCEVGRELGFNQGHIISCCLGKRKTANGYRWEYADGLHQKKQNRPIVVTTTEDDFIAQFKNAAEASRCLGISEISIRINLKGTTKTTHNLKFRYLDEL